MWHTLLLQFHSKKDSVIRQPWRSELTETISPLSFSKKWAPVMLPNRSFYGYNGLSLIFRGLSGPEMRQFCSFAYHPRKKLDVSPSPKYAIMWRKKVPVLGKIEKYLLFGFTLIYSGDIWRVKSKTIIHRSCNICKQSSLSLNRFSSWKIKVRNVPMLEYLHVQQGLAI